MMGGPNSDRTLHAATAQHLATWARHTQAKKIVQLAVSALGDQARAMPLKGALVGALKIVSPAQRQMRDVDLMILGIGLGEAVHRLGKAGFRITDIPWSHGYVSLRHPDHDTLWLDLHTVAMPLGFGRLTRSYMFEGAQLDHELFGARVHIPARVKLIAHLIANIVKDRVVYAYPHAAVDLAAAVTSFDDPRAICEELRQLSLTHGGVLAITWALRHTEAPALAELLGLLEPDPGRRARHLAHVRGLVSADRGDFWSRLKGRTGADNLWLRGLAPIAGAASVLTWPARQRWLLARNRGDDV
jgi:hypothetical protein